jgi:hypothetical protein
MSQQFFVVIISFERNFWEGLLAGLKQNEEVQG